MGRETGNALPRTVSLKPNVQDNDQVASGNSDSRPQDCAPPHCDVRTSHILDWRDDELQKCTSTMKSEKRKW